MVPKILFGGEIQTAFFELPGPFNEDSTAGMGFEPMTTLRVNAVFSRARYRAPAPRQIYILVSSITSDLASQFCAASGTLFSRISAAFRLFKIFLTGASLLSEKLE